MRLRTSAAAGAALGTATAALLLCAPPALAACPLPAGAGASLTSHTDAERLAFLRAALDPERSRARAWSWSWRAAYGALTVGQAIPAALVGDHGLRTDLWVGAASSAAGLVATIALPLDLGPTPPLPEDAALPPECAALVRAERQLEYGAASEAGHVDWTFHAANLGVNAAFGLVLGLGYGRWPSAALNFFPGLLLGELTAWTQPLRLPGELERYRTGRLDAAPAAAGLTLLPLLSHRGAGVALGRRF